MNYLHWIFFLSLTGIVPLYDAGDPSREPVYFTTGFKIGEVSPSSVVFWTRLCGNPYPVPVQHGREEAPMRNPLDFDDSMPVDRMDGAVEGTFGQVRLILEAEDDTLVTGWEYVSSYADYTFKKHVTGLSPHTRYKVTVEGRKSPGAPVTALDGAFTTAPLPDSVVPVTFTSSSCQYFWDYDDPQRGFRIYDSMSGLAPLFHCQTGDYVYYDKAGPMATRVELARHKWHANNAWPALREFYRRTPVYLQKDDHDMLFDDASPNMEPFGELTFRDGLKIWYEQVPITGKPYRTFRWGKDLQVWFVEGREFRTDNWIPDGPEKTIWGEAQKKWFVETVTSSDATFRILCSPTPVVGPDRSHGKRDNHANEAFRTEGEWLREFLAGQGMYVINGDRHWQYVSEDPETGLLEFSQGASSDSHAQGWSQDDVRPEHHFLRVKGGFLAVSVFREAGRPVIEFTHYNVHGAVVYKVHKVHKVRKVHKD